MNRECKYAAGKELPMSYTALYRKFRPTTFDEVKGQEHIVTTLQNQIKANRIGHAYLFCGTRGTGKTTVAKILAKAVNCLQPEAGNPCGRCVMCQSIAGGASMNVVEIDAASNNGVDNIRDIREEVNYRPGEGRFKVYIIDEVHMLSAGAYNALLKTLEEPPEYVIFILATTEVHRIPVTILSRCQQYDFKRITVDTLVKRIYEFLAIEQVEAEEKGIRYIAKVADGSFRDALSLLDQCIAFHMGQVLTYDKVLEVLGAVDTDVFGELLRHTIDRNVGEVLRLLDDLVMEGRELSQIVQDFTWYLRNLLLIKTSGNMEEGSMDSGMEEVLDLSTESWLQRKEEAKMIAVDTLLRYIRIFSEVAGQIRYSTQKRVLLEVAFIKLSVPQMETHQDSLLERIRSLEEKVASGVPVVYGQPGSTDQARAFSSEHQEDRGNAFSGPSALVPQSLPTAIPEDIQEVVRIFRAVIVHEVSPIMRKPLSKARLSLGGGNRLMIVMENATDAEIVKVPERKSEVESIIQSQIGKQVEIEIHSIEAERAFEDSYADIEKIMAKEIKMEIMMED